MFSVELLDFILHVDECNVHAIKGNDKEKQIEFENKSQGGWKGSSYGSHNEEEEEEVLK